MALLTNRRNLVKNKLDDKLGDGNYHKAYYGIDDSVFSATHITRVTPGSNITEASVDDHDDRYHANDY